MTDLNSIAPSEEDEISLLDLLQVVVDNLRLLVFAPLAAGLIALGITFLITPTFTATTKFLVPQSQSGASAMMQSLGALSGLVGATGLKNPADQYVSFLQSTNVQDALIERFKLIERYDEKLKVDARKSLAALAKISSGTKDGIITVEVDDKDPEFAAQLANAHIDELQRLLSRLAITEAQQRRVFFEKLLTTTKDNWVKAEQALKSSGLNSNALKLSPQTAMDSLAKLKATIMVQEVKLSSMRGYLTDNAPEFKQAQTELAALRSQLSRAEKEEPATSAGDSDYIAKYRDFKYNETLFELFSKQYEIARIDEAREGANIQVIDVAQPPERKSKPKKALIAVLTTLAVGFALLLFVFIRSALQGASQDPETTQKLARLRAAWAGAIGRA